MRDIREEMIKWLQSAAIDDITVYLFNRLFRLVDGNIPLGDRLGLDPENFVIYAYQSTPQNSKQNLDVALTILLEDTLKQINLLEPETKLAHQQIYDGYSRCLSVAESAKVLSMAEPLQKRLIDGDRISNFAYEKLLGVRVANSYDSLNQSLLTLMQLEDHMGESQKKVLSEQFWINILEEDKPKEYRGAAVRGLGYLNWRVGLEYLPKFIDSLTEIRSGEHPDDKVLSLAAALGFFIKRSREKPLNGLSLENHRDFLSDVLTRYREENSENWQQARTLLERATTYLINRRDTFSSETAKSYFKESIPALIG